MALARSVVTRTNEHADKDTQPVGSSRSQRRTPPRTTAHASSLLPRSLRVEEASRWWKALIGLRRALGKPSRWELDRLAAVSAPSSSPCPPRMLTEQVQLGHSLASFLRSEGVNPASHAVPLSCFRAPKAVVRCCGALHGYGPRRISPRPWSGTTYCTTSPRSIRSMTTRPDFLRSASRSSSLRS